MQINIFPYRWQVQSWSTDNHAKGWTTSSSKCRIHTAAPIRRKWCQLQSSMIGTKQWDHLLRLRTSPLLCGGEQVLELFVRISTAALQYQTCWTLVHGIRCTGYSGNGIAASRMRMVAWTCTTRVLRRRHRRLRIMVVHSYCQTCSASTWMAGSFQACGTQQNRRS